MALYNLVKLRLKKQGSVDPILAFSVDVEYIEELITRISSPYTKEILQNKYVDLFYRSKKTPISKAMSYDVFKAFVKNMCEDVVEIDEKFRKEMNIPD